MRAVTRSPLGRTTTLIAAAIGSTLFAGIMVLAFQNPASVIGAMLLVAAAVAVIRFPIVALVALLFVEPFHFAILKALENRAHVDTGVILYWKDALLLALFVRSIFERAVKDLRFPIRNLADSLILLYILAFVVIAIASPTRPTVWPALGRYIEGPILMLTIVFLRPSRTQLWWCVGAVVAAAAVMGAAGMYEHFFARYDFHRWYGAGVGESRAPFLIQGGGYRSGSFVYDPFILGFFLAGSVPLTVALSVVRSRWRPAVLLAVAACGGGLLVAATRSGYVGGGLAVLVALLLAVRNPARRVSLVGLAVVILGSISLYYLAAGSDTLVRPESDTLHRERVSRAFAQLEARPFGYGLGTADHFSVQLAFSAGQLGYTENTYLSTALESGMQGLTLYLVAIFATVMRLRTVRRRAISARDQAGVALAAGAIAAMVGISVCELFIGVHELVIELALWAPPGIALAWHYAARRQTIEASSPRRPVPVGPPV